MLTEKLELVLSVIDSPKDAVETVIFKKQTSLSLIVFLLAGLSVLVSGLIANNTGSGLFLIKYAFLLVLSAVILFAAACVLHFAAELMRGKGDVISLYSLLNFSLAPLFFLVPAAVLGRLISPEIGSILTVLLFCWPVGIIIYSVEKLYGISQKIAVIVVFFPVLLAAFVVFIVFAVSIGGIVALLL